MSDALCINYQQGDVVGTPAVIVGPNPFALSQEGLSTEGFPVMVQSFYYGLPEKTADVARYAICFTPQEAIQIADKLYELASKDAGLRRLDLFYSEHVVPGEELALTAELNQRTDYPIGLTQFWPGGAMTQNLSPYEARQLGLALLSLASLFEDDLGG